MDQPRSGPVRDRQLAAQPRYTPRRAAAVADLVQGWMKGAEAQRLRRNRHIAQALARVLSERELPLVEAVSAVKGTLTLSVADHLLLTEMRNLRQRALIAALAETGTGLSRIRYRLKKS